MNAPRPPGFAFSRTPLDTAALRNRLTDRSCGGYTSFEGWVRDHNEGQRVTHLEYEAFEPLAIKEGERILGEAIARFGIERAACVHRVGDLTLGETAVWVGVSARHRDEAFRACRYIIDEVKHRLPIWKKEHYESGDSGWVNCERCAAAAHESGGLTPTAITHAGHDHGSPTPTRTEPRLPAAAPAVDYSRQIALKEIGPAGQARLRASRVLVVGAGGLGVPVLTYLAAAGVGTLGLVDGDRLEPSNLHRQPLYALADAGRLKVELAVERLRALNPEVEVRPYAVRLDSDNGAQLIEPYELIIDCTDNFATKFLLNDLAQRHGKPTILASVYQFEGQLQVIRPDREGACLRCIWPQATRDGLIGNCAEAGVLGPVPGLFGTLEALEALKILLDLPGQLGDELLVLDTTSLSVSRVRARRATECRSGRCARIAELTPAPRALEIAFHDLDAALAQGFELIDVREAHEVAQCPVPGPRVRHVPLQALLALAADADPRSTAPLDPRAKYLLICASGKRSLACAQALRERGIEAFSLPGGVTALERLESA